MKIDHVGYIYVIGMLNKYSVKKYSATKYLFTKKKETSNLETKIGKIGFSDFQIFFQNFEILRFSDFEIFQKQIIHFKLKTNNKILIFFKKFQYFQNFQNILRFFTLSDDSQF